MKPFPEEECMPKNMGIIDRVFRVILALGVPGLYLTGHISGTAGVILGILAVIFVLTGITGFCPLYAPFKLSTKEKQ